MIPLEFDPESRFGADLCAVPPFLPAADLAFDPELAEIEALFEDFPPFDEADTLDFDPPDLALPDDPAEREDLLPPEPNLDVLADLLPDEPDFDEPDDLTPTLFFAVGDPPEDEAFFDGDPDFKLEDFDDPDFEFEDLDVPDLAPDDDFDDPDVELEDSLVVGITISSVYLYVLAQVFDTCSNALSNLQTTYHSEIMLSGNIAGSFRFKSIRLNLAMLKIMFPSRTHLSGNKITGVL